MVRIDVLSSPADLPSRTEVKSLYASASGEPPLNEPASVAELYASVYESSVTSERIIAVSARDENALVAFAYGHLWKWDEQQYQWAYDLRERLGPRAADLDETYSLNLLARDPDIKYRGVGREVLTQWMDAVGEFSCWLQTTDIESPARRLYSSLDFEPIGDGPVAPNGAPGLVLLRPAILL